MSTKDTIRVQMELPQASLDRLKFLKERTEAASYAEVSKNAYKLYEMVLKSQEEGETLLLQDSSGATTKIKFFS